MTTVTRVLAWVLALALAGGLVVLVVAGVPAAGAALATGAAVLVMIVLGGAVGGRHTPARPPVPAHGTLPVQPPGEPPAERLGEPPGGPPGGSEQGAGGGTMTG